MLQTVTVNPMCVGMSLLLTMILQARATGEPVSCWSDYLDASNDIRGKP